MKFLKLDIDQCYAYLIANKDDEAIIIDPKLDYVEFYLNLLKEKGLTLKMVIDTHSHADHLSGATYLKEKTNCSYGMHKNSTSKTVDRLFNDDETFKFGELEFKIFFTEGHTNNSISIICEDKLFTGDSLFLTGAGRDDLPTGDYEIHYETIKKFNTLPDHLILCPGHNYTGDSLSSLWLVKKENPLLKVNTLDEYKEKSKAETAPESWMGDLVKINNEGNIDINAFKIPTTKSICQSGAKDQVSFDEVTYINKNQLKEMLSQKEDIILLDVREPKEFEELKPIEGYLNIPLDKLNENIDKLNKNKTIISICRSGARATKAAKILNNLGFEKVLVLQGGMKEWHNS